MGGGLESRCVGRVYGANGAVRRTAPSATLKFPWINLEYINKITLAFQVISTNPRYIIF